jgi:hypothetical protein
MKKKILLFTLFSMFFATTPKKADASLLRDIFLIGGTVGTVAFWNEWTKVEKQIAFLEDLEEHLGETLTQELLESYEAKEFAKEQEESKLLAKLVDNELSLTFLKRKNYVVAICWGLTAVTIAGTALFTGKMPKGKAVCYVTADKGKKMVEKNAAEQKEENDPALEVLENNYKNPETPTPPFEVTCTLYDNQ